MDNRNNENEMDMIDGETTMPRMDVGFEPEHLDELPDMENVEDFVGGDRVYDEETAGALAALMFAKNHPEEESASKVAVGENGEENAETPKHKMKPAAVLIIITAVLLEMAWGLFKIMPYDPSSLFVHNTNSDSNSFVPVMENYPTSSSNITSEGNFKGIGATTDGSAAIYSESMHESLGGHVVLFNYNSSDSSVSTSGSTEESKNEVPSVSIQGSFVQSEIVTQTTPSEFVSGSVVEVGDSSISIGSAPVFVVEYQTITPETSYSVNSSMPVILSASFYRSNLPDLGGTANVILLCLYELLVLGKVKTVEIDDDVDEDEADDTFGDDIEAEEAVIA